MYQPMPLDSQQLQARCQQRRRAEQPDSYHNRWKQPRDFKAERTKQIAHHVIGKTAIHVVPPVEQVIQEVQSASGQYMTVVVAYGPTMHSEVSEQKQRHQ